MTGPFDIRRAARPLIAALLLTTLGWTADASVTKKVFAEEFGASYCGYCYRARCALAQMEEEFGEYLAQVQTYVLLSHFGTQETQERAARYGVGAIPHVRFDGKTAIVGAQECELVAPLYREAIQARLDETNFVSPVAIDVSVEVVGQTATVTAVYEQVDPGNFTEHQATLYIYEDDVHWCCGYNGIDQWDRVVRLVRSSPVSLTVVGQQVIVAESMELGESVPENLRGLAVLEKIAGDLEVVQSGVSQVAADVPWASSSFAAALRLVATPNPFAASTELRLRTTGSTLSGPLELSLLDATGRVVRRVQSESNPLADWRLVWDGTDEGGALVKSGFYLALLRTHEGTARAKLLRLR